MCLTAILHLCSAVEFNTSAPGYSEELQNLNPRPFGSPAEGLPLDNQALKIAHRIKVILDSNCKETQNVV